jgi:hypothetical protein
MYAGVSPVRACRQDVGAVPHDAAGLGDQNLPRLVAGLEHDARLRIARFPRLKGMKRVDQHIPEMTPGISLVVMAKTSV